MAKRVSPFPPTRHHDRAYALFLVFGLLWLGLTTLIFLSLGAPTPGERSYYHRHGMLEKLDTTAVHAADLLEQTALYGVPLMLVLLILAVAASYQCRRHYPLTFLRVLLLTFFVAAGTVGLRIFLPAFLLVCAFVYPLVIVAISLVWFLLLRRRAVTRGTAVMTLSFRARKWLAATLIWVGAIGCLVWPIAWMAHFRYFMMGGHPSSHPMFTIFLGFIPFAVLLGVGLIMRPYRRWRRGLYSRQPPPVA